MDTQYFQLACPTTGETVRVGLNAAELFSPDDLEACRPETQLWWSSVVRNYELDRAANPREEPGKVLEGTLRAWPDLHPVQQV